MGSLVTEELKEQLDPRCDFFLNLDFFFRELGDVFDQKSLVTIDPIHQVAALTFYRTVIIPSH